MRRRPFALRRGALDAATLIGFALSRLLLFITDGILSQNPLNPLGNQRRLLVPLQCGTVFDTLGVISDIMRPIGLTGLTRRIEAGSGQGVV